MYQQLSSRYQTVLNPWQAKSRNLGHPTPKATLTIRPHANIGVMCTPTGLYTLTLQRMGTPPSARSVLSSSSSRLLHLGRQAPCGLSRITATCSTKTFEVIYQTLGMGMGGSRPFYGLDLVFDRPNLPCGCGLWNTLHQQWRTYWHLFHWLLLVSLKTSPRRSSI